ncbi:hypothetical protein ACXR0O_27835 [Verrucomicrobiota bacterium sgz303538]
MQTLFAFLPVAQTTPNGNPVNAVLEQLRQQSQVDLRTCIISFIIGQIIAVVGILIASKTVVPERQRDTLANALRVWVKWWLIGIVALVLAAAAGFIFSAANALHLAGWGVLVIWVLMLLLDIRVVMGTYRIRFFRGLGLIILTSVIWLIGQIAVSFVVGPSPAKQWALLQQIQKLTPEQRTELGQAIRKDRQASVGSLQPLPGEQEARDRSKPLLERAEALKTMYAELEKRREALPPGDDAAKATYERQKARYEALLDQLRAEAHSQQNGQKPQ